MPRVQPWYFWNSGIMWRKVLHEFLALCRKSNNLLQPAHAIRSINQTSEADLSENISFPNISAALCIWLARSQVSSCSTSPTWQNTLNLVHLSFSQHLETISLYKCHYHSWFSRSYQRRLGRASLYGYFRCCSTWALTSSRP